jgi:hypothetical protein
MGSPHQNGGSSPLTLPSWLQPLAAIITQVGVPTVIAMVLLYFVLTNVSGALQKIQEQEDLRTTFVAQMQKDLILSLNTQTEIFKGALDAQTGAFDRAIDRNIAAIERNVAINREQTDRLERLFSSRAPQN